MAFELFSTATAKPPAAFCDASFILDLLTHEVASVGPYIDDLTTEKVNRAAEATSFFYRYIAQGTRFVSSPYTFQEVSHALGRGILRNSGRPKFNRWKDLQGADLNRFATYHAVWMSVVEDAWKRLQQNGIRFTVPTSGHSTDEGVMVNATVVEVARLLKITYAALDAADTYHIAMGLACGVDWFVSVDGPWKDVAEINVFCDK